jgi:hypothetical protein
MKERLFPYFLLVLAFLPALTTAAAQDTLEEPVQPKRLFYRGYVKSLQTAAFTPDRGSLLTGNLLHKRLNFRWELSSSLTARTEFRTRAWWGEQVRLTPEFDSLVDYENGLMDLSAVLIDEPGLVVHAIADRLLLNWRRGVWDLSLGRQRINWGMSTTWNPNDLFNAYNFFDFDYEERPGSDGLRLRYALAGGMSVLEAAVSRQQEAGSTVAALLYRFNRSRYDIQLLAGLYKEDLAAGLGWAGSIGQAGFRGEATYFHPKDNILDEKGVLSATAGIDYSFEGGWYAGTSALYSSAGSNQVVSLEGLTSRQLSPRLLMPYRLSFLALGSRQWTPLFTSQLNVIFSPPSRALILFPVLTWSVADNWDVDLVGQSFFLRENDVFGNQGNVLILRMKWGF